MANEVFVKVRPVGGSTWTILPVPSDYDSDVEDFVDSARNAEGVVVASLIRANVHKVICKWNTLSQSDWTTIATFFDTNFYFECYFYNTHTGTYTTKTMYVGGRKATMTKKVLSFNNSHEIVASSVYYSNVSLSLIEV